MKQNKIMGELFLLFSLCLLGVVTSELLPIAIPASVTTMLITLLFLLFHIIKEEQLSSVCDFLCTNLAFFFIPTCITIMDEFELIRTHGMILLFICFVGTMLTFLCTAMVVVVLSKVFVKEETKV